MLNCLSRFGAALHIHCDNLISLQKSVLTNFIVTLSAEKLAELGQALAVALDLPPDLFS